MAEKKEEEKLLSKNKGAINAYMKYSGMGIQMALIIALLSWAGVKLDAYFGLNPLFTVIFSLGAVFLAMFVFIKQVLHESKNSDKERDSEN